MRFSFLTVVALTGLSVATPVIERRADAVSILTDLLAEVKVHTGAISTSPLSLFIHELKLTRHRLLHRWPLPP